MEIIIGVAYISFILGLVAHRIMDIYGISDDFWDGFTFKWVINWIKKS